MEKVIKEYGHFLLAGAITVSLILLLFFRIEDNAGNRGVFEIIGASLGREEAGYDDYTDFDTVAVDALREKPVITYTGGNEIHVGELKLSDYIHAFDFRGSQLPIRIISVITPDGTELPSIIDSTIGCMNPGIYTVQVSAVDDINKKAVCKIRIPVSR